MKRLCFILIAIIFMASVGDSTVSAAEKTTKTLLLVPLDSRPVNTDVPKKVGAVSGVEILLPPENTLGDLDTPGDKQALHAWLKEEGKQADAFLLAADMLTYGGLVASRTADTTIEEALQSLELLEWLKETYPNKPIFVYSSILRLAPSMVSEHDATAYEQLRNWAILMGDKTKNQKEIQQLEQLIAPNALQSYINTRERNHTVNKELLTYAKRGLIDVLVFGQDDAAEEGIHQKENETLKTSAKKEDGVFFVSGIDEVGSMLVTRFALLDNAMSPRVFIAYDHPFAPFWQAPFDDTFVAKNIKEHLDALGMKRTIFPFLSDFTLYVNTPYENWQETPKSQVAIADIAFVNQSDADFVGELLRSVPLHELYSYSGWNTGGNAIGLSLSFAGARLVSFDSGEKKQTVRHAELLYRSLLLDHGYKSAVYPMLKTETKKKQHDPYSLRMETPLYEKRLNEELNKEKDHLFQFYFEGKHLFTDEEGKKHVTLEAVYLPPATFPWKRLFEIRLSPEIKVK